MFTKPVLFLIFNRLDTTKQVFEAIRQAKPPRLYIASDGPRENREGEAEKVQKVRDYVLSNIDWDCELKTLFRDENLGCGKAVSGAITWLFENEEDGIILEDDCLPHPTFFSYCEELLDYYKDNEQVMTIGSNQFFDFKYGDASYYFESIHQSWGWASWRRAWKKYDFTLENIPKWKIEEGLFYIYNNDEMREYWLNIYYQMINRKIDTWDYQWVFSIIANNGLCVIPNTNLMTNIGFSGEATHTGDKNNPLANNPSFDIGRIIHATDVKRSQYIDEYTMRKLFNVGNKQKEINTSKNKKKSFYNIAKKIYRKIKKYLRKTKTVVKVENNNFSINKLSKVNLDRISYDETSKLKIGKESIVEASIIFDKKNAKLSIGDRTFIGGAKLFVYDDISIGDDVEIAWGTTIMDTNSHSLDFEERKYDVINTFYGNPKNWDVVNSKPIKICDKVWIGFDCIILKGVTIGEGAVISAGSVVTKNVPSYTLVRGNPAEVIRKLK